MSLPPFVKADDKVILFDGVCRLCNGWVRFLLKYDEHEQFKLCSVQSAEGQALLAWFGLPTDSFETMLLVEGEMAYTKSEALFKVLHQLPGLWQYLELLAAVPRPLRDWCYDRIARNRYKLFGRYKQCVVPTSASQKHFLGH